MFLSYKVLTEMMPADQWNYKKNTDHPAPPIPPRPKINPVFLREVRQTKNDASLTKSTRLASNHQDIPPPPLPPKKRSSREIRRPKPAVRVESQTFVKSDPTDLMSFQSPVKSTFFSYIKSSNDFTSSVESSNECSYLTSRSATRTRVKDQSSDSSKSSSVQVPVEFSQKPNDFHRNNSAPDLYSAASNVNVQFSSNELELRDQQGKLLSNPFGKKRNSNLIDLSFWDDDPKMAKLLEKLDLNFFDPLFKTKTESPEPSVYFDNAATQTSERSVTFSRAKTVNYDRDTETASSSTLERDTASSDESNLWSQIDDTFEMLDPFDVEALKKASELAKRSGSTSSSVLEEEKSRTDSTASVDSIKRQHKIQTTLKYSRRCNSVYDSLDDVDGSTHGDKETLNFCEMVKMLREQYTYDSEVTNVGMVISPTIDNGYTEEAGTSSIRLVITTPYQEQAITFTCDVTTSVEHVISHVACCVFDDISTINLENYVLKVHGLAEYLALHAQLVEYEYVHLCLKYDQDVRLTMMHTESLKRPLARTAIDDANDIDKLKPPMIAAYQKTELQPIKKESLIILIETFDKEVEKMRGLTLNSNASEPLQCKGVIQAVKAICSILSCIETSLITEAIDGLRQVAEIFNKHGSCDSQSFFVNSPFAVVDIAEDEIPSSPNTKMELLQYSLERINGAIWDLLEMYCRVFHVDFCVTPQFKSENRKVDTEESREIASFPDTVLLHVGTVHKLRPNWASNFSQFQVMCTLYYGDRAISPAVATKPISITKSFYGRLHFDDWLHFDTMLMCTMPRETRAVFKLYGIKELEGDNSKQSDFNATMPKLLGWNSVNLFSHDGYLIQGSVLCGLWPSSVRDTAGPSISNQEDRYAPLLQVNFPEFSCPVYFPPVLQQSQLCQSKDFDSLDTVTQRALMDIVKKDILTPCTPEDQELLWDKRHYMHDFPEALPRVLLSAHSWDWACLSDIYTLLNNWKPLQPINALQLLLPSFPDVHVRKMAVVWLKQLGCDELCDYLPQIVQALKFDMWLDSSIVLFLLERSLMSVRVAHQLYWLLKQNMDDVRYKRRMTIILNTLLCISGNSMRERFKAQEDLVEGLTGVAKHLKTTKESLRLNSLVRELESLHYQIEESNTSLPLNPSLEVEGIEVKSCSYFPSNTLPLRLVFKSSDSGTVESIYKVGDDLRQDALTLQMIRIMDKLWLRDGLDLKIVTFQCIATGNKKGMVEMVTESETLRKIHTELGVTGSFKDRTISEWLQKHNPSELEYQQAVENFMYSCAGYAVATYILGICDRHNDNIMLKTSGHLFHIDFGKFLGDAQRFGSIRRDRVPFVLTSDMVYVINGGDRPTSKFQYFVDICCQAFNTIRHHGNLFLNLFTLMVTSGIPGVTMDAVRYVQNALLPGQSDALATATFTRLIQDSMHSKFTQLNFFIHNLAQMRFSGDHNDNALLSFVPKTYTMETEGKIIYAELYGVQKRYDQEKYYVYIIKVDRERQPDASFVSRSYREFCEFDQRLRVTFPLAKYNFLPRDVHLGRSNIRQVADKRKVWIDSMLKSLVSMAPEIAHSDLVYTFFHPLLRDQQESAADGLRQQRELKLQRRESISLGSNRGQVQLSTYYKSKCLYIMIMHAKYLNLLKGGLPDPYVKTYLLPDPNKRTKRKTRVVRRSSHPTFMEMLIYEYPLEIIQCCTLRVTVWHYESLQENEFLGGVLMDLRHIDLSKETGHWHPLGIM